jgi:hypothetical protein
MDIATGYRMIADGSSNNIGTAVDEIPGLVSDGGRVSPGGMD